MNISISKIRSLPYYERVKFIFLLPGKRSAISEIYQLLTEYPDWDHEQLEQLIVDNDLPDIDLNIYTHKGINTWRIITYLCNKDTGTYLYKLTETILYSILRWNHEHRSVCLTLLFTTLFDNYSEHTQLMRIIHILVYCVDVVKIPIFIDVYMYNILSLANEPDIRKIIKRLLPYVKGKEMVAYINDCLSISDIIC